MHYIKSHLCILIPKVIVYSLTSICPLIFIVVVLLISGCCNRKWIWEKAFSWCHSTQWHRSYFWWYRSSWKCEGYIKGVGYASFTEAWTLLQGAIDQGYLLYSNELFHLNFASYLCWFAICFVSIICNILSPSHFPFDISFSSISSKLPLFGTLLYILFYCFSRNVVTL